jgi:hypothetical protein
VQASSPKFIVLTIRKTTTQDIFVIFRDVIITPQVISKPYTIIESDFKLA